MVNGGFKIIVTGVVKLFYEAIVNEAIGLFGGRAL